MKIVKIFLLTLVAMVAIAATIGFLSPSQVRVQRSIMINAPSDITFAQVNDFRNWKNWSPWYRMDTAMKMDFNDVQPGAGSSFKWASNNRNVGSGDMTMIVSSPDSIVTAINLEFGSSVGKFLFTKKDSGVNVTWVMEKDMGMNPIGRIMGRFMDKMIGPDFESGLANLKQFSEAIPTGPKTYRGYEVKEEDAPEKVYIIKKDSMTWDSIETFCSKHIPVIIKAIEKAKLEISGPVSSLYFKWDSVTKTAEVAVAVPIAGDAKTKVKGFETYLVPAGKNLHIVYMGGYSQIGNAHFAINEYIKEHNFLQGTPVTEEYVSGPDKEADSSKWITNVYYRVR